MSEVNLERFRNKRLTNIEDIKKANWLKIMVWIKDEDLIDLQSSDFVLYLKYLRYLYVMFFFLMILNLASMVPVYATGKPNPDKVISSLGKLTVQNVLGTPGKIIVA